MMRGELSAAVVCMLTAAALGVYHAQFSIDL